jgi:predicted RNA binding protein YcfA (HicA-like mRNA interferase family)
MNKILLLEELMKKTKDIRFERLSTIAETFGFKFKGGKGSHRIYVHDKVRELINFQNVNGKAKPYQVKQFIKLIEKYNLIKEGDNNV